LLEYHVPQSYMEYSCLWKIHGKTHKSTQRFLANAYILGLQDKVGIICPDNMRLKLFLESMRQQLGQLILHPKRIHSLNCPFKEQRSSCCGFGHYLQNIWAAIPNEERCRLKPPAQLCLS
jgi:hypothetical protein